MLRRMTTQKRIVYQALEDLGHASVEALIEYLRNHNEHISLATIYRNIQALLAEQKIRIVKLKGNDVLETIKEDHAHFVCEECGSIEDIFVDKNEVISKMSKVCLHQIKKCDIAFYGLCQNCTKKGKGKENEVRL
ncbi:MAG: transcriptional repressor [Roseburia sp.]|nr:transcriptional repressor [Anaeroplasma bactoclasticum]MCM1196682.1 transcriptional repressor [Roseburia sp.]MCM1557777.1 transcriptional repressor [Anaeroplasma bactoclasticum]